MHVSWLAMNQNVQSHLPAYHQMVLQTSGQLVALGFGFSGSKTAHILTLLLVHFLSADCEGLLTQATLLQLKTYMMLLTFEYITKWPLHWQLFLWQSVYRHLELLAHVAILMFRHVVLWKEAKYLSGNETAVDKISIDINLPAIEKSAHYYLKYQSIGGFQYDVIVYILPH